MRRLVAQQAVAGGGVQAELQGHRGGVGHAVVACLPDLAEAAHPQQLDQLQIADAGGAGAGAEARRSRRQERLDVVRLAERQGGGDGAAGRVVAAGQSAACDGGDLLQVGGEGRAGLRRRQRGGDLLRLGARLFRGGLGQRLKLGAALRLARLVLLPGVHGVAQDAVGRLAEGHAADQLGAGVLDDRPADAAQEGEGTAPLSLHQHPAGALRTG
jgi:hypothetical protein